LLSRTKSSWEFPWKKVKSWENNFLNKISGGWVVLLFSLLRNNNALTDQRKYIKNQNRNQKVKKKSVTMKRSLPVFLIIITIKLILLKIRVRTVKFQIYEWQRATGSGVEPNASQSVACLPTKRADAHLFVFVRIYRD
jgi:hypothetical protein